MSFGLSIGDILAAGELAWNLYHDCYRVARGAPQEFQLLLREISDLSNSLKILQDDAQNPNSALAQAGENRVRAVKEMVKGIEDTLKKLKNVAQKYAILGSGSKCRQLWTKFKWSVEFSDIDKLRYKLVYHNTVMNLLLTSVGNSSLERIVSSTATLQSDIRDIKSYILSGSATTQIVKIPSLSVVEDDVFEASLTAALMKNAEISQPWNTIGVDVWIEAGRWWLLRSQVELFTISAPNQKVPLSAYANLIKSSWILIDIIASHPQVTFVTASTHSEVRLLSAELKREFARLTSLKLIIPDPGVLESQDLQIWEVTSRRPRRDAMSMNGWTVAGGEQILFQGFATGELRILTDPLPCILLFLVQDDASAARLVAQHQDGSVLMTVNFQQPVSYTQLGNSVIVNDVKLIFKMTQDSQTLGSVIEATSWYMNKRTAAHADLDDLKAFVLLTAVKNNLPDDPVARLLHLTRWKNYRLSDGLKGGAPCLAVTMASLHLKHELNQQLLEIGPKANAENDKSIEDNDHRRKDTSLMFWAIQCGHLSLVELLAEQISLQNKEDTGVTKYKKTTPLGLASLIGHEAIARILLVNGADPNQVEEDGGVALLYASRSGHQGTVRLLLSHGAKIESRTMFGRTSLHEAAQHGHANVMETLIAHGADIEARCDDREVALHHASCNGHQEIVRLLLRHGAGTESKSRFGRTSLHNAAQHGHANVMKTLIDHGADIEARGHRGATPVIEAAIRRHEAAILLLLKAGANLLAIDDEGMESRHWIVCIGIGHHPSDKACPASNDLVNMIYQRACNIMYPSLACPPLTSRRRTEVIFGCITEWAQLWLCSHHAHMEILPDAAPNLTVRHERTFRIGIPGVVLGYTPSFRFSIVHQEDVLDFAVAFGKNGFVGLRVVEGGERTASNVSSILNFQKWDGVEINHSP